MKKVLLLLALCLAGCVSPIVRLDQLPAFGDPVPGTIHVIAGSGFKRPGHYYLPQGATLGLLIDVAGWKPVKQEHETLLNGGRYTMYFLSVQHNRGRDYKTDYYHSFLDKNGMPYMHRKRLLLNGDEVLRSGFAF